MVDGGTATSRVSVVQIVLDLNLSSSHSQNHSAALEACNTRTHGPAPCAHRWRVSRQRSRQSEDGCRLGSLGVLRRLSKRRSLSD